MSAVNVDLINAIYDKIDTDADGQISQGELDSVFKSFDKDGNGQVSRDEFCAEFVSQFGGDNEKAGRVFGKLDKDNSGDISLTEISALFKLMDGDGDGTVSKGEFVECWKGLLA